MWKCKSCGESIEETFDTCWKCGTSSQGVEDPTFAKVDDVAPDDEAGAPPSGRGTRRRDPRERSSCERCRSTRLMRDVWVADRTDTNVRRDLQVAIDGDPQALFFKERVFGSLRADICAECGHVELFVSNPDELYRTYRRSGAE